jgi:hypothetical protein
METANTYLDEVVNQQARVEEEMKRHRLAEAGAGSDADMDEEESDRSKASRRRGSPPVGTPVQAVDYRVSGFWRWRTVVVPPNVYVVHTRRGHAEPLHTGLGISFRYNPATDAFLVVPAAVQTLIINARCICAERQGVLVQAYVQWIVDDVRTAYRKLDFSDPQDPMRIVNVQLREQAEAAIKDKVATMPIDEILSDKQPIIEELTTRLRAVAEGSRDSASYTGLGLKIVTVQIKEAVVSSTRLWENLQKPFRAERERLARLAELDAQQHIARQELADEQARETAALENQRQLAQLRAAQEREVYDRDQAERARRHEVEQLAEQQAVAQRTRTEKARKDAELELTLYQYELENRRLAQELAAVQRQLELERARGDLERLRTATSLELQNQTHEAQTNRAERDVAVFKLRRAAENDLTEQHVRSQLIERLPEIAAALPQPQELRSISIGEHGGAGGSVLGFVASALHLVQDALKRPESANGAK